MIQLELNNDESGEQAESFVGRLVLAPNHSSTWRKTSYFLLLLLALSLTIAFGFTIQGYWMILPFSILEVSVVATCFYFLARRARYREVIEFSTDEVIITSGIKGPERRYHWPRFFTKIMVHAPRYAWYAPTIELRHRNENIEVGSFLNPAEKTALVKHLHQLIKLADANQVAAR